MKKKKLLIGGGIAFVLIGIILISIPVYMKYKADKIEGKMISDFKASISSTKQMNHKADSKSNKKVETGKTGNSTDNDERVFADPYNTIALVEIPAIQLEAPVVNGQNNLNYTIGKYTNGVDFGGYGNVILAGHNDMGGSIFRDLRYLDKGDVVTIVTKTGKFKYQVYGKTVVLPTEVSVLDSDPTVQELTLITCTDRAKKRVIIKCHLIK